MVKKKALSIILYSVLLIFTVYGIISYLCRSIDTVDTSSVREIISPEHPDSHREFLEGRVLIREGKYQEAINKLLHAHKLAEDDIVAKNGKLIGIPRDGLLLGAQFEALAYCYYKLRNFPEAEKHLGFAMMCRRYAPYYQARAIVYQRQGKFELAAADRRTAEEILAKPSRPQPRNFQPLFLDETLPR